MRYVILMILLGMFLAVPVQAEQMIAPDVPIEAQKYMPKETGSFGEDLWFVVKTALSQIRPELMEAAGNCLGVFAAVVLLSILSNYLPNSQSIINLTGTVAVGVILLKPINSFVQLGASTIAQISEYGKLLLPVMTASLAAQGGTATSATLYTGTAFFDAFLSSLITQILTPMLYMYLVMCIAYSAAGEGILNTFRQGIKWCITWGLKVVLYIFTGYITITGVVSGTTDAAAMKAAKLTISGAVPVVGGILSDASEAVLVGTSVIKNSAGLYGLVAVAAILVGPFLQIGMQYLLLKLTGGICSGLYDGRTTGLVKDISGAMGLVLAMTGAVSLLLLISVVCFMRCMG